MSFKISLEFLDVYESASISSVWKGLQIVLYIIGALSSIVASFSFGSIYYYYFDNNCLLYSSVTFVKDGTTVCHDKGCNSTTLGVPIGLIDLQNTNWDKDDTCAFCIFTSVCSFITSLVWATFFTMCGKGGRALGGLPSSWRIVFPALVFNTVYFIISLVAAFYMMNGITIFCTKFMENMKEDTCYKLYDYDQSLNKKASLFLSLATIFIWISAGVWLLSIMLLIIRCIFVSDFELFNIQIHDAPLLEPKIARNLDTNAIQSKHGSNKLKKQTENLLQKNENNNLNIEDQERQTNVQEQDSPLVEDKEAFKDAQLTVRQQDLSMAVFGKYKDSVDNLVDLTHLNQKPNDYTIIVHPPSKNTEASHTDHVMNVSDKLPVNKTHVVLPLDANVRKANTPVIETQNTPNNYIMAIDNELKEREFPKLYDKKDNKLDIHSSWLHYTDSEPFELSSSNLDDVSNSSYLTDKAAKMDLIKLCDNDSYKSAKSKADSISLPTE